MKRHPNKQPSFHNNSLLHIMVECNKKSRVLRKRIERNETKDKVDFIPLMILRKNGKIIDNIISESNRWINAKEAEY